MDKKLEVTLVRSVEGHDDRQRGTVASMGLTKLHQSVVLEPTAVNLGKLEKVRHLVRIREV